MSNIEIIAYHGWGFDANCWDNFKSVTPDEVEWKCYDRGYFNDPSDVAFNDQANKKILIMHSFGLHLCDENLLEQADMIVIISGFLHFHPKAAQFKRRSRQVVNEMITNVKDEPHKVLKAFYRNVFHPQKVFEWPDENLNQSLLLQDLKLLDKSEYSLPKIKNDADIFIFHGSDDAIISKQKGRGLFEQFNGRAKYYEIKNSGHALPMTHAQKCWNFIESNLFEHIDVSK